VEPSVLPKSVSAGEGERLRKQWSALWENLVELELASAGESVALGSPTGLTVFSEANVGVGFGLG